MIRLSGSRVPFVLAVATIAAAAAFAQVEGTITEVRVYRGQALVTREVPVEAKAGAQEVVVGNLPANVIPESLYATGDDNLTIRAVRYRPTAVEDEPRPEVRALDEQIGKSQTDLKRVEAALGVLEARSAYLEQLQQFAAGRSQDQLAKGSLNPKTLEETTKFIFQELEDISRKTLELETEKEAAEKQMTLLQRQRATLTGGDSRTLREAVVFVDAAGARPSKLTLSYLVNGVGWAPAYSARLDGDRNRLVLEYHAVVNQMSGEDWPDVKLTLSTSHPQMLADAPILSPLWMSLTSAQAEKPAAQADTARAYTEKRRELAQQIRGGYGGRAGAVQEGEPGPKGLAGPMAAPATPAMPGMGMPGGGAAPPAVTWFGNDYVTANVLAAQLQNVELTAPDDVVKVSRSLGTGAVEGLAVDYPLAGTIGIQSRKDQQMFRIADLELKAEPYYTAVPLLTDYVYQAVEAVNDSDYSLLAGPYSAYLNGGFAGQGSLPLVAKGQSLILGFGTETRLRAARELEEKTTETRGGNRVIQYTYRIRLSNFMDKPAKVRLWDRLPQAPSNQVSVTLNDPGQPLSEDPLYVAEEKPRGLLRWDIEVPANASRATAFTFTYKFQLEFDKNYSIGELPGNVAEQMRRDIEAIQHFRMGGFGGAVE